MDANTVRIAEMKFARRNSAGERVLKSKVSLIIPLCVERDVYDEKRPVVCMDEKPYQLLGETRLQRIVLPQNQCVVKVLQNFPSGLLDLIAGEDHVNARFRQIETWRFWWR